MRYEMLVLDLDGTLTNSEKKITPITKEALIDIQKAGKKVVLASGRPTPGVSPLAAELSMDTYGGYTLSYNGGRIIDCLTGSTIYEKLLPTGIAKDFFDLASNFPDTDILTYTDTAIISGIQPNQYTKLESFINHIPITRVENFVSYVDFPVNKFLIASSHAEEIEKIAHEKFHGFLNIYRSEPFFLEIMPQHIDKANSLSRLLSSLGLTADQMICCGDGYNDLSMLEYAGLGVAMENAQPLLKEKAEFITKSNDEDGIAYVIEQFLKD